MVSFLVGSLITASPAVWSLQQQFIGQVASMTSADQTVTDYHYNALNNGDSGDYLSAQLGKASKLSNIYVPLTIQVTERWNSKLYAPFTLNCSPGKLCARALDNGDITVYGYQYNARTNPYSALSQQATYQPVQPNSKIYQRISQTIYGYNLNGQLVSSTWTAIQQQALETGHHYDVLGRLVRSSQLGQITAITRYRYDANGNIISRSGVQPFLESYNGLDQSVKIGPQLMDYDGNGNQKNSLLGGQYDFNARNQLVGYALLSASTNTGHTVYGYYANGLRAKKQSVDQPLMFYYDGDQLLNTVSAHQWATHYLLADGRFYRGIKSLGQRSLATHLGHYELLGQQGSVNGHLDNLGQLVSSAQYGAYGRLLNHVNLNPRTTLSFPRRRESSQNLDSRLRGNDNVIRGKDSLVNRGDRLTQDPFGYDGEYRDTETGLSYLRARYYNPASMHFISQDSYGLMNRYAFASGDPVDQVDPQGHSSFGDGLGSFFIGGFNATAALFTFGFFAGTAMGNKDFLGYQEFIQGQFGQWVEGFNPVSAFIPLTSNSSSRAWGMAAGIVAVNFLVLFGVHIYKMTQFDFGNWQANKSAYITRMISNLTDTYAPHISTFNFFADSDKIITQWAEKYIRDEPFRKATEQFLSETGGRFLSVGADETARMPSMSEMSGKLEGKYKELSADAADNVTKWKNTVAANHGVRRTG